MKGQMSIEDWMPEACPGYGKEPEVGAIIHKHGQNICHIMRPAYIGKKVCFDVSTESHPNSFRVGILEKYIPHEETYRSIVYTGTRQSGGGDGVLHLICPKWERRTDDEG